MPTAVVVNSLADFFMPPAAVAPANPGGDGAVMGPPPIQPGDLGTATASASDPPVDPNQIPVVNLVAPPVPPAVVTLRMAIDRVNTSTDATNTITFAGAAASGTIVLGSALPALTNNVSIVGTGPEQLTVMRDSAAATKFGIFTVGDVTASISGLAITGGDTTGNGGGIENLGNLTLTNDTIFANNARFGGGIHNTGQLFIEGDFLYANSARFGGGISNTGSLAILNSSFHQNSAVNFGGGLYNSPNGSVDIADSSFLLNYAGISGGGISNSGDLNWNGGSLSLNWTASDGMGGGIETSAVDKRVVLSSVFITNNSSGDNGGGVYLAAGDLRLDDCTVSGNRAFYATGIWIARAANFYNNHSTITDSVYQ